MTTGQIAWIVGVALIFLGSLAINAARRSAQNSRDLRRRR